MGALRVPSVAEAVRFQEMDRTMRGGHGERHAESAGDLENKRGLRRPFSAVAKPNN